MSWKWQNFTLLESDIGGLRWYKIYSKSDNYSLWNASTIYHYFSGAGLTHCFCCHGRSCFGEQIMVWPKSLLWDIPDCENGWFIYFFQVISGHFCFCLSSYHKIVCMPLNPPINTISGFDTFWSLKISRSLDDFSVRHALLLFPSYIYTSHYTFWTQISRRPTILALWANFFHFEICRLHDFFRIPIFAFSKIFLHNQSNDQNVTI